MNLSSVLYKKCMAWVALSAPVVLSAQGDAYDHSGKMWVVVVCSSVLIIGFGLFLFYLERRLRALEKDEENESSL